MAVSPCGVSLAPRAPLQMAPLVVIGTVDVAAVGARVLLSLQPPAGWAVTEVGVDLVGLHQDPTAGAGEPGAIRPVLTSAGAAAEQPSTSGSCGPVTPPLVVVRNLTPPGGSAPAVSLVVLNAVVPEGDQAEVAAALVDLITSGSSSSSILVAAAMLLQQLSQPAPLYRHLLNGAKPPAGAAAAAAPPLPTSASTSSSTGVGAGATAASASGGLRVRDGQLAALLHVLAVGGEAAACLIVPGNKPTASAPPDLPDTAAACDTLGEALSGATGLSYSPAACRAITASYKWFVPERTAGVDVMYT